MEPIVARCARLSCTEKLPVLLVAALVTATAALPASADDLDVFRSRIDAQNKPNILLVLDYSGSMSRDVNGNKNTGPNNPSRINILKSAVREVLDANLDKINAGIGSMYAAEQSGVRWPISELRTDASEIDPAITPGTMSNRDIIVGQLDRLDAAGNTATVNALAEAALYFQGGMVTNGDVDPLNATRHEPDTWDPVQKAYTGGNSTAALPNTYSPQDAFKTSQPWSGQYGYCHNSAKFGGNFNNCDQIQTDLIIDCETLDQARFEFNSQFYSTKEVERCRYQSSDRWDGANYISPIDNECSVNAILLVSDGVPTRRKEGGSINEVVGAPLSSCEDLSGSIFANNKSTENQGDCGPEIAGILATTPQIQGIPDSTVKTYTVGFAVDGAGAEYLDKIAKAGQGSSEIANNVDELTEALNMLVDDIKSEGDTFTELAIDVDRASFSHNDRAYFNLFNPTPRSGWQGNTKGYYMTADGLKDIHGNDVANADGTGFAENIQSFWSNSPDGNRTSEGGASEQMTSGAARNLYTAIDYDGGKFALHGKAASRLRTNNPSITAAHLDLEQNSPIRDQALAWLQTAPMGDPLHTRPVSVEYASAGNVVFTMTNQGFLHAIDASSPGDLGGIDTTGGNELFAFMPERLLKNLPELMDGVTSYEHVYGMDGGITRIHDDANNNGIVDPGDSLMLVVGMRRGGDSYYALDVTDPNKPSLVWSIDSNTPGFGALGETWSKMALIQARSGKGSERFLVFSGGYDAATLDDTEEPTPAARGNALFVIDTDGKKVWSVDGSLESEMRYAIAADPTIIDSDGDGLADRMYVGDLGGQVWRVDFDDMRSTADYDVTRLADLSTGEHQPFFYSPSIALNSAGGENYMSVSLGSGDRTDPMNAESTNRLWMLRDTNPEKGAPAQTDLITAANLYDATDNLIDSNDPTVAAQAKVDLANANGWRIDLELSEKSLSRVVTFEGKMLATTFEPVVGQPGDCGVDPIGRYYQIDIATGSPNFLSTPGTPNTSSGARFQYVPTSAIPSSPVVVFPEGTGLTQIFVGLNRVQQVETRLSRVYWHAR